MSENSSEAVLDLLDAITEIRVANPDFRPSVLQTLRLMSTNGQVEAGRLYSLRHDGEIKAIISHGSSTISEDEDQRVIELCRESREPYFDDSKDINAFCLGKDQRVYGVLILEKATEQAGPMLADIFLQWHAVAEFINAEKAELLDENFSLREEIRVQYSDHDIVGVSGSFKRVLDQAHRVAASSATVLIQGETGTGKELVARLIHNNSPRSNKPFITVNCGALTETLLETELFGHVKGAFTGAVADHKGKFEAANKGTIFLDEIGEVSPAMQVRLLRVLQEMEVVRVGEHKARKLDVRVIAATNRDLEEEVRQGNFRSDLFYRLNVIHLNIPPLRSRVADIPILLEHFLSIYCQRNFKYIQHVDKLVLETMKNHTWPGNVRELENCVEKMVVLAPKDEITVDLLPMSMIAYSKHEDGGLVQPPTVTNENFETLLKRWMHKETVKSIEEEDGELYDTVRCKWERYLFESVLSLSRNNKSKASRILGITRNTLNTRLTEMSKVNRDWNIDL